MNRQKINDLEALARNIRIDIVRASYSAGKNGSHLGGCLSMAEMLGVLYNDFVHFDSDYPVNRDRVIMSKGHGALALYAVLHQMGFLTYAELTSFEKNGSEYTAHAHRNINKGLEFTGGSLGLGVSFAAGVAYACRLKGINNRIYCFLGDGELNEGIVWESLMFASQRRLSNFTIIIDNNHLQIGGHTEEIINMSPLVDKFESFGFYVALVDGQNVEKIHNAYEKLSMEKPNAIVAETIKGKGVSFAENKYKWHFGVLNESRYNKAMGELGVNV